MPLSHIAEGNAETSAVSEPVIPLVVKAHPVLIHALGIDIEPSFGVRNKIRIAFRRPRMFGGKGERAFRLEGAPKEIGGLRSECNFYINPYAAREIRMCNFQAFVCSGAHF